MKDLANPFDLSKSNGRKNLSKLQKKVIVNKLNRKQTVYVKVGEDKEDEKSKQQKEYTIEITPTVHEDDGSKTYKLDIGASDKSVYHGAIYFNINEDSKQISVKELRGFSANIESKKAIVAGVKRVAALAKLKGIDVGNMTISGAVDDSTRRFVFDAVNASKKEPEKESPVGTQKKLFPAEDKKRKSEEKKKEKEAEQKERDILKKYAVDNLSIKDYNYKIKIDEDSAESIRLRYGMIPENFAKFFGAPPFSEVRISYYPGSSDSEWQAAQDEDDYYENTDNFEIRVENKLFGLSMTRRIDFGAGEVYNDYFKLTKGKYGAKYKADGMGARITLDELKGIQDLNDSGAGTIHAIVIPNAAGSGDNNEGYNGYYTWLRYGFDKKIVNDRHRGSADADWFRNDFLGKLNPKKYGLSEDDVLDMHDRLDQGELCYSALMEDVRWRRAWMDKGYDLSDIYIPTASWEDSTGEELGGKTYSDKISFLEEYIGEKMKNFKMSKTGRVMKSFIDSLFSLGASLMKSSDEKKASYGEPISEEDEAILDRLAKKYNQYKGVPERPEKYARKKAKKKIVATKKEKDMIKSNELSLRILEAAGSLKNILKAEGKDYGEGKRTQQVQVQGKHGVFTRNQQVGTAHKDEPQKKEGSGEKKKFEAKVISKDGQNWMQVSPTEFVPVKKGSTGEWIHDASKNGFEAVKGEGGKFTYKIREDLGDNEVLAATRDKSHDKDITDKEKEQKKTAKDKSKIEDAEVGDVMKVRKQSAMTKDDEKLEGITGKIQEIGARVTKIVNNAGKVFEVPNRMLEFAKSEDVVEFYTAELKYGMSLMKADSNNIKKSIFEAENFFAKAAEKLKGGEADGMPDSKFDKKQLKRGMKEESEHTDDKKAQKEIAKDHIAGNKNAYKPGRDAEGNIEKSEIQNPFRRK